MIGTSDMPWLSPDKAAAAAVPKTLQVVVAMAFLLRGVRQEIGTVLTLPEPLARELLGYRKVHRYEPPDTSDTAAAADPSTPAPVKTRRKAKE